MVVLGAALLLAPAFARAADATERPIVAAIAAAPDACYDGNSLAASIGAWLNKTTIDARIAILVRRPAEGTLRFTVEREGKLVGERDMPAGTLPCPDLRAALSLAIAIAIDHTLLDSLGIEAPPTEPTERENPKAPTSPAPAPAPGPLPAAATTPSQPKIKPADERAVLGFALEAEALFGVLPGPALGASPRISFMPAPWLAIRGAALGTTRAQTSVAGGTASAGLLAGRLEGCVLGPLEEVRGAICAGAAYGGLSIEGSGLEPSYSPSMRWAAGIARVEARYPARSALGAVVAVDGVVPLLRPELQVVDRQGQTVDSWRAPVAGFGVSLGADLLIW